MTEPGIRIRIVSDGTTHGTFVTDADTGQQLRFVKSITWQMDARDKRAAIATIDLYKVEIDVQGTPGIYLPIEPGTIDPPPETPFISSDALIPLAIIAGAIAVIVASLVLM